MKIYSESWETLAALWYNWVTDLSDKYFYNKRCKRFFNLKLFYQWINLKK